MTKLIETETRGHVLVITLNRPQARNAFNLEMAEQMEAVLDAYEADVGLRAAVIRAEGPTFSAGQDLIAAARGEMAVAKGRGGFGIMNKPPMKPLIAAVEGQALAGGMEVILCCDLIVASTAAVFGLAEAKRGLVALGGGCFRLPRRLPYQVAMEMIMLGETRTAEDMHRFGFVNRLVEPGTALDAAVELAEAIARNGPLAVRASKEIAARSVAEQWTDADGWANQGAIVGPVMKSADLQEGLRAFAEKRAPIWTGT
jgi:enoyl-CoA hydratase